MMIPVQTLSLSGETYVVVPQSDYERLLKAAGESGTGAESPMPALPAANDQGRFPAVEYARAVLARKLIARRQAAGLSQAELARRAKVRIETLNRIERSVTTPTLATIEKLDRVLSHASEKRHPPSK